MITSAYIRKYSDINSCDVIAVGSKNALLGDMYTKLSSLGINVPDGFAVTSFAFEYFLTANALHQQLHTLMSGLDKKDLSNLNTIGATARALIMRGTMPYYLVVAIRNAYDELCEREGKKIDLAVRSSTSAESLPLASFAGLHESFLNISDADDLLDAIKQCFASLYTNRAIKYREENHFTHAKLFFSVGVQKMIHAENGCSGFITASDSTGHKLEFTAAQGLHKNATEANLFTDHFFVYGSGFSEDNIVIVKKPLHNKKQPQVGARNDDTRTKAKLAQLHKCVLTKDEITTLATWTAIVQKHYAKPMDLEWAKDGNTGKLYIVGARPAFAGSVRKTLPSKRYVAVGG
jgi:pyruvate,water dikinase